MEKNQSPFSSKQIITFIFLTFGITAFFDISSIWLNISGTAATLFNTAAMWSPAIAVFLTKLIYKQGAISINWKWPKTKYILLSFATPILYSLISFLIIWIAGWGTFYNQEFLKEISNSFGITSLSPSFVIFIFVLMTGVFGIFGSCANALGEEIGWRGFLTTQLFYKYGYIKTSLIIGIIWAVWHYTVLIFGDYNNGTPFWFGLICFTIMIIAATFIFTWFTIKSGSLFPAVLLHATHNLYIQRIFTPLTDTKLITPWYIGEFGIVLPFVMIVFAFYFISRRKELMSGK